MHTTLAGRRTLITGGSRGIGRGIVERFAEAGAQVLFTYHSRDQEAHALVDTLEQRGAHVTCLRADIGVLADVERLFDEADRRLSGLDVLVNNAGLGAPTPFGATDLDEFTRIFEVNARGTFAAMQHAVSRLSDGGRIVNISTVNTSLHVPGIAAYAGSKAAVEQFTMVAARELASRAITVNAVAPGATDTDLLRASNPPAALEGIEAATPLGRLGRPDDIAEFVAFLASDEAAWITGQILRASGGL